jgi:hypothetical protein
MMFTAIGMSGTGIRLMLIGLLLAGFVPGWVMAAPQIHWRGAVTLPHQQPERRGLPPACDICIQGDVGFEFEPVDQMITLSADFIVNHDLAESRSGTLFLGFMLFPADLTELGEEDLDQFSAAVVQLSSLGGQGYFADVRETVPVQNLPPAGDYYVYLFLGELTGFEFDPLLASVPLPVVTLRDFVVFRPPGQSSCKSTSCVFAVTDSEPDTDPAPLRRIGNDGGNSGIGAGGGFNGGGDQENIDKDEDLREPTQRSECVVTTRNRANADSATVQRGAATLIGVLDNDIINPEGTLALSIDAAPANGSAEVIGNAVRYTSNPGFTGSDFLTYRIGSVCGLTTLPVRVDIEVVEPPPPPPVANCPLEVKLPGELAARSGSTSLLNISTRGLVGDCNNTLRAGFINVDSEATYFIRGRGPSLGGSNPLSDPRIRLLGFEVEDDRLVEVELASNDDWLDHPTADCLVPERQLEPVDGREAALLITLPAGTYIAVLESATADGTCSAVYGNGIIEVNDVRLFPDDVQP